MATEDLTTYPEVDPNGHISATAARCTMTGIGNNEHAYRYKDKAHQDIGDRGQWQ